MSVSYGVVAPDDAPNGEIVVHYPDLVLLGNPSRSTRPTRPCRYPPGATQGVRSPRYVVHRRGADCAGPWQPRGPDRWFLHLQPVGSYSGPDGFTFEVTDGAGDEAVATASLSVCRAVVSPHWQRRRAVRYGTTHWAARTPSRAAPARPSPAWPPCPVGDVLAGANGAVFAYGTTYLGGAIIVVARHHHHRRGRRVRCGRRPLRRKARCPPTAPLTWAVRTPSWRPGTTITGVAAVPGGATPPWGRTARCSPTGPRTWAARTPSWAARTTITGVAAVPGGRYVLVAANGAVSAYGTTYLGGATPSWAARHHHHRRGRRARWGLRPLRANGAAFVIGTTYLAGVNTIVVGPGITITGVAGSCAVLEWASGLGLVGDGPKERTSEPSIPLNPGAVVLGDGEPTESARASLVAKMTCEVNSQFYHLTSS